MKEQFEIHWSNQSIAGSVFKSDCFTEEDKTEELCQQRGLDNFE